MRLFSGFFFTPSSYITYRKGAASGQRLSEILQMKPPNKGEMDLERHWSYVDHILTKKWGRTFSRWEIVWYTYYVLKRHNEDSTRIFMLVESSTNFDYAEKYSDTEH